MNKIYTNLLLILAFTLPFSIPSCGDDGKLKIDAIPYQTEADGQWKMVTIDGKVCEGMDSKSMPTVASDDRYWVKNSKGYWELYDLDKNTPVVDAEYRYVSLFRNGRALVAKRDENVTVIDKKGEIVSEIVKVGNKKPDYFSGFNGEVAVYAVDGKSGVCNYEGEPVVKPIYAVINTPEDGKIVASDTIAFAARWMEEEEAEKEKKTGNFVVFNYKGEELLKLSSKKYIDVGSRFYGDYLVVEKKRVQDKGDENQNFNSCGIININGEEVVKPSNNYCLIPEMLDNIFIYYDGNFYGASTIEGEKILPAKYNDIHVMGEYLIATKSKSGDKDSYDPEDMETQIFDKKGEPVLTKKYMDIRIYGKNIFAQSATDRWDVLNMKGERVDNAPRIYSLAYYSEGDYTIMTDKIDIKEFVSELDFTSNSMDGVTFSSSVQAVLKRQAEHFSYNDEQGQPKASDYGYTDEVSWYYFVDGCGVSETVKFPGALSHQNYRNEEVIDYWIGWTYYYHINRVPTGFTFSTANPLWFSMTFDNYGILRGKLKQLYKALCEKFAQTGTEIDSSSGATSYDLGGGKYAIIYLESHNVTAKWGKLSANEREVWMYSGNKEELTAEDTYDEGD